MRSQPGRQHDSRVVGVFGAAQENTTTPPLAVASWCKGGNELDYSECSPTRIPVSRFQSELIPNLTLRFPILGQEFHQKVQFQFDSYGFNPDPDDYESVSLSEPLIPDDYTILILIMMIMIWILSNGILIREILILATAVRILIPA